MTKYATGNPVLPNGSDDPRDLIDNSQNLDVLVTSREKTEHPDRLGVPRKTWHGMEQELQQFLVNSGYTGTGAGGAYEDYDANGPLTITALNQIFTKDGEFYRLKPDQAMPYTTTEWATDENNLIPLGDAVLRQEIGGGVRSFSNLAELRVEAGRFNLDQAIVAEKGGHGLFRWSSEDQSGGVSSDPRGGVYVPPQTDQTGSSGCWVRQFNTTYGVDVRWFGAVEDGITDDFESVQAALDFCAPHGIETKFTGPMVTSKTISLKTGNTLSGTTSTVWDSGQGSVIISTIDDGSPTILCKGRSTTARRFSIEGSYLCNGIEAEIDTYDHCWHRINVKGCLVGFKTERSWVIDAQYLRTEGCETGYSIQEGTTSTWNGCLAYGGNLGFEIGLVTYNNFISCGTDGAAASLSINGARGCSFLSWGMEGATSFGIRVAGGNTDVTFTSPTIANHAGKSINLLEFLDGSVVMSGLKIPSSYNVSLPGKSISYSGGEVLLINPNVFGNKGDIEEVAVIGGNPGDSGQKRDVVAGRFTTFNGETEVLSPSGGESDSIATLSSGFYLASAINTQTGNQRALAVISISGGQNTVVLTHLDQFVVEFFNSGKNIKIRNNSSTSYSYRYGITKIS